MKATKSSNGELKLDLKIVFEIGLHELVWSLLYRAKILNKGYITGRRNLLDNIKSVVEYRRGIPECDFYNGYKEDEIKQCQQIILTYFPEFKEK